jgi:hypothetical protein
MTGHDSHETDDKGRCLNHPAVRSKFLADHFVLIPIGFDGKAGKAKPLFTDEEDTK